MRARFAVAFVALAGCYSPSIPDGKYTCTISSDCPDGTSCDPCSFTCVAQPATTCALADPCTNGDKARAPGDPGIANVAFCPAAWTAPGAGAGPMCANAPGPDGTSGGKPCSIADNCAAGWHVCTEPNLMGKLTRPQCSSTALQGFYATKQQGNEGKSGVTCSDTGDQNSVIGCGTVGGTGVGCSILTRQIYSNAVTAMCPTGWDCGMLSLKGVAQTFADVTKASVATAGGVICCKN